MVSPIVRRTCQQLSLQQQSHRFTAMAVRHASGPGSGGRPDNNASSGDSRLELIRRVLFESSAREPTIALEGEALEQHDTIERAWKLHLMRQREQRQQTLERQFRSIHAAMSELEKTSDRLFKGAIVKSRHVTYPKQAKIPTETPSPQGWDYSYKHSTE
ncbi:mitochondrial ribosomal protein L28-domain-containing protein [Phascolomyces articulosus]|uniref:Large ribosomal subunit protein mL40 n=1 Tax=Phascolomyces articulosus TaxID=60185 RepID=A0AAD5KDZ0_9FUNG|nr:mitochondrial ribosomal protein L28-domain-containing protein [Phascolomyces articulosus]